MVPDGTVHNNKLPDSQLRLQLPPVAPRAGSPARSGPPSLSRSVILLHYSHLFTSRQLVLLSDLG